MKHMTTDKEMPVRHMADMMGEMHNYLGRFKDRKIMTDGHNTLGKHPGFKAVQRSIASGISPRHAGETKMEAAGAILASRTRGASAAAKRANPRLKRVKG